MKRLTIYEVAKKIGCSISAVSRAYNREEPSKQKRTQRIVELIQKLNWNPNFEAVTLGRLSKDRKRKKNEN